MYVVNAQQMRELDRFTIEQIGIPGPVLMENAGVAVVREIEKRWPSGNVVVLSGYGNNGGDGLVISRHLQNAGRRVKTWVFGDEHKMSSDCLAQLQILQACSYPVSQWAGNREEELRWDIKEADLVIDAMLGTGVKGQVRNPYSLVIQMLQDYRGKIVAVDIPSGVNSDNGEVNGSGVMADLTVTFAFPKWGHFLYPGAVHRGELAVADISIPPECTRHFSLKDRVILLKEAAEEIPQRPLFSHKGTYGHVLIVAGSREMTGAPVLTAMAGMRAGCGLLTLAVPKSLLPVVESKVNEPIFWGMPEEEGFFSLESAKIFKERASSFDVVAIGPGIGKWEKGKEWLEGILPQIEVPLLLDADALNLLSIHPEILHLKKGPVILTPHPAEMARLCQCTTRDVEKNRPEICRQFALRFGVYVVLKGTYTLLATPDGSIYLHTRGNAALAKGGSGDVLTGMIAGILAQKKERILPSLQLALVLHGLAGEICGKRSMHSTLAGDVIQSIGEAFECLRGYAGSHCTNFPGN